MRLTSIMLTCLCVLVTTSPVMAEEKKAAPTDLQAMMDTYKKLAAPGEPHEQLASLAGSWTTRTRSWVEPDKPPVESTGSCEQTMLLGGRFLRQECTGEIMGQSFTGVGVQGYDNVTKKYVSTWMDSMATGIFFMEGTAGPDGTTITQTGRYEDPIEGPMELRGVTKMADPDTRVFVLYGTGKRGNEMKMMEITYTRRQSSGRDEEPARRGGKETQE